MSTPAEIVRAYLVAQKLVTMQGPVLQAIPLTQVPGDGSTLCFVSSMPDDMDQAVCVFDPAGLVFGRSQRGRTLEHYGIKIMMRALDYTAGYMLMSAIAAALDAFTLSQVVVGIPPDTETVNVQSIYRTSPLISLGEEVNKRRQLFSLNARLVVAEE